MYPSPSIHRNELTHAKLSHNLILLKTKTATEHYQGPQLQAQYYTLNFQIPTNANSDLFSNATNTILKIHKTIYEKWKKKKKNISLHWFLGTHEQRLQRKRIGIHT